MASRIITCREVNSFLADYVGGTLSATEHSQFEQHLSLCPTCVRYLHQYRETVRLGKQAFREPKRPAAVEVPRELIDAILDTRRSRR
jgi:anti-sigma factor RsiW